jgi:tetratricopeptide (TPR) repeat protein
VTRWASLCRFESEDVALGSSSRDVNGGFSTTHGSAADWSGGATDTGSAGAEEAFTAGNEEFVKENWKAALEHFAKAAEIGASAALLPSLLHVVRVQGRPLTLRILEPAKSEYHLHKAAAMCKLGTYSQAIAVCDEVIAKEPANAKAHLRKGMALVSSG